MANNRNLEELIDETNELVETLKRLKNEIENYDEAKNNLVDVKDTLLSFIEINKSTVSKMNEIIRDYSENFPVELGALKHNIDSHSIHQIDELNILKDELKSKANEVQENINKHFTEINNNSIKRIQMILYGILLLSVFSIVSNFILT